MVGTSGGTQGGRERIVIVDELLPGRLKRAARKHVLRRPQLWQSVLFVGLTYLAVTAVPALTDGDTRALAAAVLSLPVCVVFVGAAVLGSTMVTVGRNIDREFVPGRLIGVTIGSHTIRYRDHDSCLEYAYSSVRRIEKIGDVVVVVVGLGFWVVPMEVLDGVSLEVLRTRAGRPAQHAMVWQQPVL